ncbi:unnamed protein product [Aphanomyces euteiches]|uniref:HAT C-terminal dimerisation domain-containing protein n=3 Tax=Aphanomyces euteiches TaxID=100861 RepID=A0A6G0WY78_9STRA|nr:hypothetical protein Ae201684_010404 [Aphanomyces euteiches]KAH9090128.1 hypothetical protein Ae201684P_014880 [Aphanomyces euteiches]KAH9132340.1 hypothetical protein AeRB84_021243 [Aphanomyces euteiches]
MTEQVSNLKAAIFANLNGLDGQMVQFQVKANPALKKSECWQKFGHVHSLNGDLVVVDGTSFVACYVCHTVYTFKSKNGTSTIMGHKCPHEKTEEKKEIKRKAKNPDLDALKREITKALLEDDVVKGYRLLSNPAATKSDCWKRFGHVYHHGTLLEAFDSGYVACYGCKVVYQYKVRNGTSTMTTHVCSAAREDIEVEARKGQKRMLTPSTDLTSSAKRFVYRDNHDGTEDASGVTGIVVATPKKALDALKQAITASLLSDNSLYELRPNASESKAECWQRFGFVYRHNALVVDHGTHFVACYDCKAVYQFKSKNGTSSLLSHACAMRKANEKTKQLLIDQLVELCTQELLPLDIVTSSAFRALWTTLRSAANGGSTSSSLSSSSAPPPLDKWMLPPDSATLYTHVQTQYLATRLVLHQRLLQLAQDGIVLGLTYAMWPQSSSSSSILSVMVHFIDGEFSLHDRVLDVHVVPTTSMSKTMPPLAQIHASLEEIGQPVVTICAATTPTPESLALYPFETFPSMNLDAALDSIATTCHDPLVVAVLQLIATGGGCVDGWPLASTAVTWTALLRALQFLHTHWLMRCDLWEDIFKQDMLSMTQHHLEALLSFCTLFVSAVQAFEKQHVPTLHTVCYWRHALTHHCSLGSDDDDELRDIKMAALAPLQSWTLSCKQIIAALLDPGQRKRVGKFGVDSKAVSEAKGTLRDIMVEMLPHATKAQESTVQDQKAKRSSPTTTATSILSMYGGDSEDEEQFDATRTLDVDDELTKYFERDSPLLDDATHDGNLLLWWKWQAKRWPLLSRAARCILSLPAASKIPDAVHSRQGTLPPANVREILFLHSNRDLRPTAADSFIL